MYIYVCLLKYINFKTLCLYAYNHNIHTQKSEVFIMKPTGKLLQQKHQDLLLM